MNRGRKPNPEREQTHAGHRPQLDSAAAESALEVKPADLVTPTGLRAHGKKIWRTVVLELASRGTLAEADLDLLTEYAATMELAESFRKRLYKIKAGDLGADEAKRIRTGYVQLVTQARTLGELFGITPSGRVRLGLGRAKGLVLSSHLEDAYNKSKGDKPKDGK